MLHSPDAQLRPGPVLQSVDGRNLRHNAGVAIKTVDTTYDIERFTARHIPGSAAEFVKTKWQNAKSKLSLPNWIEQVLIPQSEEDRMGRFYVGQTTRSPAQLRTGVKYCSPQERKDFMIESWRNGEFVTADFEPFHTGSMNSPTSGDGWAIFVVDLRKRIYAGPYVYGEFHHSSFLAGEPVLSAGEIAVDQGRVVGLTNKTGHYKSGPAQLKLMLELLQAENVSLQGVAVNDPIAARDQWFTGVAALKARGDLAKLGTGKIDQPAPVAP